MFADAAVLVATYIFFFFSSFPEIVWYLFGITFQKLNACGETEIYGQLSLSLSLPLSSPLSQSSVMDATYLYYTSYIHIIH